MEHVKGPIDRNFMEMKSNLEIFILSSLGGSGNLEEEAEERL